MHNNDCAYYIQQAGVNASYDTCESFNFSNLT